METAVGTTRISFFSLLLIGVMVGLVVLLVRKNRRVSIYVGIGFVLVVLGGVFLYKFTGDRLSERYVAEVQLESISQQAAVRRESYSSVDPIWQVTVENEFEADVYPSVETAADALGRKIAPKITSLATQRKPAPKAFIMRPGLIEVFEVNGAELESRALKAVWQELNRIIKVPSFTIELVDEIPHQYRSNDETLILHFDINCVTRDTVSWTRTARQQKEGELHIIVRCGREKFEESVQFIEKPWVTNFSLFLSQEPGEHYIIAQSKKPCTSSSEARYEAMADAAKQLAYRIIENAGHYRMQFNVGKGSRWALRDIQALVRTELEGSQGNRYHETSRPHEIRSEVSYVKVNNRRGKYISDRFVQGFQRPYGAKIWREALLVNASKENIDELAGMYAATIREKRESWLRIVLSAIGMLGMVCVVYVFLNSATKGYYTWALRAAVVVLAMVIIGIAMVLA